MLNKIKQKNSELKNSNTSVSFTELSQLGTEIQEKTFNKTNKNIAINCTHIVFCIKYIAFHIGTTLTKTHLIDSYSIKLREITNIVRNFVEENFPPNLCLEDGEKEQIQTITNMLEKVPNISFKNESYVSSPIQSINTSIRIFLKKLNQLI